MTLLVADALHYKVPKIQIWKSRCFDSKLWILLLHDLQNVCCIVKCWQTVVSGPNIKRSLAWSFTWPGSYPVLCLPCKSLAYRVQSALLKYISHIKDNDLLTARQRDLTSVRKWNHESELKQLLYKQHSPLMPGRSVHVNQDVILEEEFSGSRRRGKRGESGDVSLVNESVLLSGLF